MVCSATATVYSSYYCSENLVVSYWMWMVTMYPIYYLTRFVKWSQWLHFLRRYMRVNTVPPDRIQQGMARCHTPAAANLPARPRRRRVVKITPLRGGHRHLTRRMQSSGRHNCDNERRHVARGGLLRHHHPPDDTGACPPGGGKESCRSKGWGNTQPRVHCEVGKRSFLRRSEQARSSSVSAQVKKR